MTAKILLQNAILRPNIKNVQFLVLCPTYFTAPTLYIFNETYKKNYILIA